MIRPGKRLSRTSLWILVGVISISSGCGARKKAEGPVRRGPVAIVAVNGPLRYFAERIGGDKVVAICPCPTDTDPAHWTPSAKALDTFYAADLILLNGGGYARWTVTTSLPDSKLANTGRAFKDSWLTMTEAVRHRHGPEGEHSHEATIGEFWLDPSLAIQQAERIEKSLSSMEPKLAIEFANGLEKLKRDLQNLHDDLRESIGEDTMLFAAEPAFEYIASASARPLTRLSWSNVADPTADELAQIPAKLDEPETSLFLLSFSPSEKLADALDAANIRMVVFDTCPTTGDQSYLDRMQENVSRLRTTRE
jgi:zinc transport system substrate-binding protein